MTTQPDFLSDVFQGFCKPLDRQAHGNSASLFFIDEKHLKDKHYLHKISLKNAHTTCVFFSESNKQKYSKSSSKKHNEAKKKIEPNSRYNICWWKNGVEIKRCGHGTMGAAASIFFTSRLSEVHFNTRLGESISVFNNKKQGLMQTHTLHLDMQLQATYPPHSFEDQMFERQKHDHKNKTITLPSLRTGSKAIASEIIARSEEKYGYVLIKVNNTTTLENYQPDFEELKKIDSRAFIIFSDDFYKKEKIIIFRYFAPQYGNNEDPATGSAAAILSQYFGQTQNVNELTLFQASKEGGIIKTQRQSKNIIISGQVTIR